jgi:hypothetical protein
MAARESSNTERRRSADRRAAPREGTAGARGRRATDRTEGSARDGGKSSAPKRKRRSTRDGREPLVIYLRPESIKALKIAALEDDTTASAIVADALDRWLHTRR